MLFSFAALFFYMAADLTVTARALTPDKANTLRKGSFLSHGAKPASYGADFKPDDAKSAWRDADLFSNDAIVASLDAGFVLHERTIESHDSKIQSHGAEVILFLNQFLLLLLKSKIHFKKPKTKNMASRIPLSISGFNNYINDTDNYMTTGTPVNNGTRLGLSAGNITDWATKRTDWQTNIYPKYINPLQSTSAVKQQVRNFMKSFRTFAQPLLNIMAANPNAVEADAVVFNFKIGRADPSRPVTPIGEGVVFEAKSIGGGNLKFSCRTAHDSNRASKAARADSVQLSYMFAQDGNTLLATGMPTADGIGMAKEIFTRSVFTFHAGANYVGWRLIVFMRWFNTRHPELAGPWSAITIVVIA